MTGRTPACEDAATIQARLRELQAERMAAIAGCSCAMRNTAGEAVHLPGCPLRAPPQAALALAGPLRSPPSQAALALAVAMERLRARHKRRPMTEDERATPW